MPYDDNERTCFNDLVMEKYGSIDAEWMVNTLSPSHKTGNTHMVSYNYNTRQLYFQVSYNKKLTYQRPTLRIQLGPYMKF